MSALRVAEKRRRVGKAEVAFLDDVAKGRVHSHFYLYVGKNLTIPSCNPTSALEVTRFFPFRETSVYGPAGKDSKSPPNPGSFTACS